MPQGNRAGALAALGVAKIRALRLPASRLVRCTTAFGPTWRSGAIPPQPRQPGDPACQSCDYRPSGRAAARPKHQTRTPPPMPMPPRPVISFERVSKTHGALRALDGVSLTVQEREFLAVGGPSGSAKTTLLRLGNCHT